MGINFLANGPDLAPGDEVVSTDQEHGGGISPWRLLAKRRGVVVKELPYVSPADVDVVVDVTRAVAGKA